MDFNYFNLSTQKGLIFRKFQFLTLRKPCSLKGWVTEKVTCKSSKESKDINSRQIYIYSGTWYSKKKVVFKLDQEKQLIHISENK